VEADKCLSAAMEHAVIVDVCVRVDMYVCICMWLYLCCIPTRGERSRRKEVGGWSQGWCDPRLREKCVERCEAIMPCGNLFVEQNAKEEMERSCFAAGAGIGDGGGSYNIFFFIARHSTCRRLAVRMDPRSCQRGPRPTVPANTPTKRC
jgi:hypothetical protein